MNEILSQFNEIVSLNISNNANYLNKLIFLIFGGFLSSLLPCVYPLYPISTQIIKQRGGNSRTWIHPLAFVFGISITYFLFGVFAGITGALLNEILKNALSNFIIGYCIFLLGFATIGWLELPFFGKNEAKTHLGGISGTFIIGMLTGLLSSPCVSPVVVSILLKITTNISETLNLYQIILTGLETFFFGIGLGIPFLIVGVFGLKLPKSGNWLRFVQVGLSLLVFYFSYQFFMKGFNGLGVISSQSNLIISLYLLILYIIFKLQSEELFITEKVKKSILYSLLLLSLVLLFNLIYFQINLRNQSLNIGIEKKIEIFQNGNLKWFLNKEDAIKEAKKSDKKIFIDFYADWCTNCKEFEKLTLQNEKLNFALSNSILLKITEEDPEFEEFKKDKRFSELNIGLPFFVIINSNEELLYKTSDYLQYDEMIHQLNR